MKTMGYRLKMKERQSVLGITIVGVGGTGGFVAESLCRLLTGHDAIITLVDHDRVERHNILRQNFYENDIGAFKAEALAGRLARNYRREIRYCTTRFENGRFRTTPGVDFNTSMLIGCVDNAEARGHIAEEAGGRNIWVLDAGNGKDWGQVLIGNATEAAAKYCAFEGDVCHKLPLPTVQRPDLLTSVPDEPADIDCAAALDLTDQDPTINQMMATVTISMVRQMLGGTCETMAVYVDQKHGNVTAVPATPENASQVLDIDPESLNASHAPDVWCDKCRNGHWR